MLMPKRVKRRRVHRGRMKGVATKGNTITYGAYGLVAQECGWITSNQIEAARVAMTRSIKRGGKVYIKIFPHKSVTKKPAEVRMGSGKGAPEYLSLIHILINKYLKVSLYIDGVFHAIRFGNYLIEHGGEEEIIQPIASKETENRILSEVFHLPPSTAEMGKC